MPVDKLEALLTPNAPLQMIKWDSRAANGVIDEQGQVGWIDFEHSGLRGGYEDFAWLLADETMPILYQTCYSDIVAVLEENARHVPAHAREHFVKRIEVFATLQASVRLRVIKNEVDMKSWTSQEEILSDDVVGADPFMGERVAENAAFLAARNEETEPTVDLFVQTAQMFRDARKGGDLEELRL